jgi:hypothetical protein
MTSDFLTKNIYFSIYISLSISYFLQNFHYTYCKTRISFVVKKDISTLKKGVFSAYF